METQVLIGLLITITLGLIGIVYWIHRGEIGMLKTRVEDLQERVQRIEDVQGNKIDELKEGVKDFKNEIKTEIHQLNEKISILSANVHNQKNTENQLSATMNAILKHLQNEK